MAYAQNTITDVNASNVIVGVMDGLLTTAGWTTVETLTPSGNFRNRIYKSSGASNLCGYDWYIAISWTTVGTANYVRVIAAETYNPATHILGGICGPIYDQGYSINTNHAVNSTQPTTGWSSPSTLNMTTSTVTTTAWQISAYNGSSGAQYNTYAPGMQTLFDSSAFAYWCSVTLDHFALWSTVAANSKFAAYSTLVLDPSYSGSALFDHTPIVDFSQTGFEMSSNFIGVAIDASHYVAAGVEFSGVFGAKLPALTDTYYPAYAWQPYVYLNQMVLGSGNPVPQGTQITGRQVVGHVPDILLCWGGSIGDTILVDSATYVLSGPSNNIWSGAQPSVAVLVE